MTAGSWPAFESIDELRHRRDHAARACADLLVRGHLAEAKRYAKESERFGEQIRAALTPEARS